MTAIDAVQGLHRFGLGPRPGDGARYGKRVREALEADLDDRSGLLLTGDSLMSSQEALFAYWKYRDQRATEKATAVNRAKPLMSDSGEAADSSNKPKRAPSIANETYRHEIAARLSRVRQAEIGFGERLVAFWTNHFTVSAKSNDVVHTLAGAYERALRPHVLGRFEDLLIAASKQPAMLRYLDNARSIGPNSRAGINRARGLNENHAREIMELHTVGVDGGYTQADVAAFARVLTGWTFGRRESGPESAGKFAFQDAWHEPGPQTVLGKTYKPSDVRQGEEVLRDLARRPATARHIAGKMARAFVADAPSENLIRQLENSFRESGGDLKELARTLIRSDEAWAGPPGKLKSPQEFLWSAIRGLNADLPAPFAIRALRALGQQPWFAPSPAGYPNDTASWLAPDALTNRLDLAEQLAERSHNDADPRLLAEELLGSSLPSETREAIARAESRKQALALLLMSPDFQRR